MAQSRFPALDGWRGISITLVLAAHMLPLGPKSLGLNGAIAATGMSLFFILSGFLIVSMLAKDNNVSAFLVRRACRIVPLAWTYLILVLTLSSAPAAAWRANLLFYANLPPFYLDYINGHFWSLCLEVQFYVAIATLMSVVGKESLSLIPAFCVAVTCLRIWMGAYTSIVTWLRLDEILAGGIVALLFASGHIAKYQRCLPYWLPLILWLFLVAAAHPASGPLNYFRPYFAAALIASTSFAQCTILSRILVNKTLRYLAEISYALYVIHPLTTAGWLGQGDTALRYCKRIISFALTFGFAHLSTRYFERYWIAYGHRAASALVARNFNKEALRREP